MPPDTGEIFTGFEVGTVDAAGNFTLDWVATDLPGFTAAQLVSILTDSDGRYDRFVGLFDDDTTATGTALDDTFELGAGNDAVTGKAGDDLVRKWKAGDLDYYGGGGFDTLSFDRAEGNAVTHLQGAMVNLETGTGRNPMGGRLTLTSVEGVSGTALDDLLLGNNKANQFFSGKGGADTIRGFGGDDAITVDHDFGTVSPSRIIAGGAGFDTLAIYGDGPALVNVLNLNDQAQNTGVFAGGSFTGFESYVFLTPGFTIYGFDVTGTDAAETFRAGPGNDMIDGGGGNDRFTDIGGADVWIGGGGTDRVDYALGFAPVRIDLAAGTGQGGAAQGDSYGGVEDVTGSRGSDSLFGNAAGNRLAGADGNDLLLGRSGEDVLVGGGGRDTMDGGGGSDRFVFFGLFDSGPTHAAADLIRNLQSGIDLIDLRDIDARPGTAADNDFDLVTGAFTAVGQVRVTVQGAASWIELNTVAGGGAEMVIKVTGDVPVEADFLL